MKNQSNKNDNQPATIAASSFVANNISIQKKLAIGAVNDALEHEADAVADKVMRMPETGKIHPLHLNIGTVIQKQDKDAAPTATPKKEDDTTLKLQLTQPDFLSLRAPFLQRNVPQLWDPASALGIWQFNLNFFKGIGLDDNWSGKAANLTAPFFINAQLKAGNPTWWEITDRDLKTSSFVGSLPLFDFGADFKNWRPLPFLQKKASETTLPMLQRKCNHCEEEESDGIAQRKPLVSFIQKKENNSGDGTASDAVASQINATKGGGNGMESQTQTFMESSFGTSFQDVRIHTNDSLEHEADTMADKVVGMSERNAKPSFGQYNSIQRKCNHCEEEEKNGIAQRKPLVSFIQKKENNAAGGTANDKITNQINATKNSGNGMDGQTKSFMESRFGTSFQDVRIHTGGYATELSQQLNAQAFTVGNNVYFNQGKYDPNTTIGKHLLAHELTHTIQQTGDQAIQRVPMPEESTVSNLESYSAPTRQNIKYDAGFNLQSGLHPFFQQGIVMAKRPGYNVTFVVQGFPPKEEWVGKALKALALYNFNLNEKATEDPVINYTTVQHLDMSGETNAADAKIHGPNAMVRLTATSFDTTGKGATATKNVQLLIEKTGNFSARTSAEKPEDRRKRYANNYQITNAVPVQNDPLGDPPTALSDDKFDKVLIALDVVPTSILGKVPGIPIYQGLTALGPKGEIGEYHAERPSGSTTFNRKITVYANFFTATLEQQAFTITHEIGHALDERANETATGKGGASLSIAKGKGRFTAAVDQDGGLSKGMSEYAATNKSLDEYYAESFSMYINQPATLKALRPHVFDYFKAQYP